MKVVVLSNLPRSLEGWAGAVEQLERAGLEVVDPGEDAAAGGATAGLLADADALIVGMNPVTRELLEAAPRLVVVAKPGIGVDTIDLDAATELGIRVCNTPGSNAETVADHTLALVLALFRRIVPHDRAVRGGTGWDRWPPVGGELHGKTISVIGTGAIGRAVIRRAVLGFGMEALAFDIAPDETLESDFGVQYGGLEEILGAADVATLHVPLTEATRGLIGAAELALLKPSAVVVNTSRGGVVDEAALVAALRRGTVAGAALDVFESEPCTSSPLFALENVVLSPHSAGFSPEAAARSRAAVAENVLAALSGRAQNVVNPEVERQPSVRGGNLVASTSDPASARRLPGGS